MQNRKSLIDIENELMVVRGEEWKEGIVKELGMDLYTLLYLKCITNKDLLHSTGSSAQCCVVIWMGESSGENGYMYMHGRVPSLFI